MKKKILLYTDTNSGNKLQALKNVAEKNELLEIPEVTFKEPKIKEDILMTENKVNDAAIRRCHRPSVEIDIKKGGCSIGIQKGFYRDKNNTYYLIHVVSLIENGRFAKPIIECAKIAVNEKIAARLKTGKKFTSPIPLYEQLTGKTEISWFESTIEKAVVQVIDRIKKRKEEKKRKKRELQSA